MKSINWLGLAVFYVLAAGVQYGLRHGGLAFYNDLEWPFLAVFGVAMLCLGGSVAVAAFISWMIFGRQNRVSGLFGTQPGIAIVMVLVPPVVVGAFGYANDFGLNPHLAGAAIGGLIVLYALGEEIGWRGFMNDALSPVPMIVRALMIGVCWWAWHFWFLDDGSNLTQQLRLLGLLCGLSLLFIAIIGVTRSWLSVAAFHAAGNIAFFAGSFDVAAEQRLMMGGIVLAVLIGLYSLWQRADRKAEPDTPS